MFTGIVQGLASIKRIERKPGLNSLTIQFPPGSLEQLQTGASIAINGTCLTVTRADDLEAQFDVMQETLRVTTLGQLNEGDAVNFERAARIGDEIGGHLLSSHVHALARVISVVHAENNVTLTLEVPLNWRKYVFAKGYIGLNGASLTIGDVRENRFDIHLIPETLRMTTFGRIREGDWVNLEIDSQTQTIVDTLERMGITPAAPQDRSQD